MKLKINTDGFEGYAKRALERARKLDRREAIKPEITITFENPLAMVEVLTAERLRLVQKVRIKSLSIFSVPGSFVLSNERTALRNASLNVRPIAIASPTDFICVVR